MPSKFKDMVRVRMAKTGESWQTAARNVRAAVVPHVDDGRAVPPVSLPANDGLDRWSEVATGASEENGEIDDGKYDGPRIRAIGPMSRAREPDERLDALLAVLNAGDHEVDVTLNADRTKAHVEQVMWMGSNREAWDDAEFEWTNGEWKLAQFGYETYGRVEAYEIARWEQFDTLHGASEAAIREAATQASLELPEIDASAAPWASDDVRKRMREAVRHALVSAFLDEHAGATR